MFARTFSQKSSCFRIMALGLAVGTACSHVRAQDCIPQYSCSLCSSDIAPICRLVSGAGAFCGAEGSVTHGTEIAVELGAEYCGVSGSIHLSRKVDIGHSYHAGDCQTCQLYVCWQHAHYEARTCTRMVADQWECDDFTYCHGTSHCHATHCHVEVYTVTSFVAGEPAVGPKCEETPCFCKDMGHPACPCPPAGGTPAPAPTHGSGVSSPNGSQNINFSVSQLANKGSSLDPGPLDSWDALSMAQLSDLRDRIEDAIDSFQYDRTDTEIALTFAGGAVDMRSYASWSTMLSSTKSQKIDSKIAYDVDGNGIVDFDDLLLAAIQLQAADLHWAWLSRADVDGDGGMTSKDLCLIQGAIVTE